MNPKEFDIMIIDQLDTERVFEPQEDITPRESVLITQGFLVASLAKLFTNKPKDLWGWIQHHNLERHFPPDVKIDTSCTWN